MTTGDPKGFRFRESTRAPYRTQVSLRFERDGEPWVGQSANVSMEGMFVQTNEPKPVGTLIQFSFQVDSETVQGLGDVVWVRTRPAGPEKPPGMGVQFRYIDPHSRDLIFRVVDHYLKESKEAEAKPPRPGSGMVAGAPIPAGPVARPQSGPVPRPSGPTPQQLEESQTLLMSDAPRGEPAPPPLRPATGGPAASGPAAGATQIIPAAASPPPRPIVPPPVSALEPRPAAPPPPRSSGPSSGVSPRLDLNALPTVNEPVAADDGEEPNDDVWLDQEEDARPKRRLPLWLAAVLVVAVLGGAGYWWRERLLALVGLGGAGETTVAQDATGDPAAGATAPDAATPDSAAGAGSGSAEPTPSALPDGAAPDSWAADDAAPVSAATEPADPFGDDFTADMEKDLTDQAGGRAAAVAPPPASSSVPAALPAPAALRPAPAASGVRIAAIRSEGGAIVIDGITDLDLDSFSLLRLAGPPRLVVRVRGVTSPVAAPALRVEGLRQIRTGLHQSAERGDELHVVFDLVGPSANTKVTLDAGNLRIEI